jgi:two-component system sensor histidine kinase TctE
MTATEAAASSEHPPASFPSLRRRMLWQVMLPLALTWLLGTTVAVSVAYLYTRQAFDRSMLDDAYAIDSNVSERDGQLAFSLNAREVGQVLFDRAERVYFSVLREDGSLLAGQGGLRDPLDATPDAWVFEERHYRGVDLRMVTLARSLPLPHLVVVAQTTRGRTQLVQQLLAASVAPQAVLLLLLGLWLRRSVARELQPLAQLESALAQRDANDLAPLALQPRTRDIANLSGAFNALMARIAAGVRAQREFAGNVAHELRTPLAGIRSLAEYGLAQKDPAAWAAQLRLIVSSEARASHLVDQLLALALADEARDSLQLEPLAIDTLVQDLLLRLLPRADAAGVDLGAEGLEQPLRALGTVALVEGLLGNLVDNALRYGRPTEPGVQPRVTVAAQPLGDELLLTVTDNGPGMEPGQQQRVLERWAQGRSAAELGTGSGLGLAIVARYVALLGGRMSLRPVSDGTGLRVSVWLRGVPADPVADALRQSADGHPGRAVR